jgi:hypothetical protein
MSASIWIEEESGIDRRPTPRPRHGYWSGNQGQPIRRPRIVSDETGSVRVTTHTSAIR